MRAGRRILLASTVLTALFAGGCQSGSSDESQASPSVTAVDDGSRLDSPSGPDVAPSPPTDEGAVVRAPSARFLLSVLDRTGFLSLGGDSSFTDAIHLIAEAPDGRGVSFYVAGSPDDSVYPDIESGRTSIVNGVEVTTGRLASGNQAASVECLYRIVAVPDDGRALDMVVDLLTESCS